MLLNFFKLLLLLVLFAQAPTLHKRLLIYYVGHSTVLIQGLLGGGGSGFQVQTPDGPRIITNAHVCAMDFGLGLLTKNAWVEEDTQVSRVIKVDKEHDLCMLTGREDLGTLRLGFFSNGILDRLAVIGHPYMEDLSYDEGMVTGFQNILGVNAVTIDADIFPGNSGSPAVNFFGQVVGVVFAGSTMTHHGVIIPLTALKQFLLH